MKNIFLLLLTGCLHQVTLAQDTSNTERPDSIRASRPDTTRLPDTALSSRFNQQLGSVIVKGRKPLFQQQPGGIIVNVEGSILSKGSSVLDILQRSPGVLIDPQNNDIRLNGKAGVLVMLNGQLQRMPLDQLLAILNGISANDIEKIELLNTPPAQYDAEGSAGIINIVLKRSRKPGTNGSLSLTGGYGYREKGTASFSLSHNTTRTDLYGSLTLSHDRSYGNFQGNGYIDFPPIGGPAISLSQDTTLPTRNNYDATLGLDVRLNPRTTIGASLTYNGSYTTSVDHQGSLFDVLPDSILSFEGTVHGTSRWNNLLSSIYLEKKFREGEQLTTTLNGLYYDNNNPSTIQSTFLTPEGTMAGSNHDTLFAPTQQGLAHTTIQVAVGKIDYTRQLSSAIHWAAGLKGTYTHDLSSSGILSQVNGNWVDRSGTTNNITMKEGIGALYTSLTADLSSKFNLVAGLRYEYSHTHMDAPDSGGNTIDRRLGEFFPNLTLTRHLGSRSDLYLSYSQRISRPSYNDLASYIAYSGPIAAYTGNPFLQPTITYNLKLGYTNHGYSLSVLLSRDKAPIARYQLTASPAYDLLYISPQNLSWENYLTMQTSLPFKIGNWWNMNYDLTGGWRQFSENYTILPLQTTWFAWTANFSETFTLPKQFSLELSGWYNSASYNGVMKNTAVGAINMGVKKELKNDKGTLQLSVNDLFRTLSYGGHHGYLTKEVFDIKNTFTYHTESARSPILRLSYSRSFGSDASKRTRNPLPDTGEENDRVRKN